MTRSKRELWTGLVHPEFGGPVFPVVASLTPGVTNAEYVIFTAPRNVAIRRASVAARADLSAATATATIENTTDSEDLTSELDLSTNLSGDASDDFVMADPADFIDEGDVVVLDYDSDTDPNELVVVMEIELLELKHD